MGLLGSIGKALVGGSKKTTGQKTSSTFDNNPWDVAIPYLTNYLSDTEKLYGNTPMFSQTELDAVEALRGASNPSSFFNTASGELEKTASGDYLTPDTNPYLADIAKRVSGVAGANAAAMFGGRGRTSGGLAAYNVGKAIADSATDLYGSAYENERSRQLSAAGQAPTFEAARIAGPAALLEAGQSMSARPFDLNAQKGGLYASIAGLGGQGTTTSTTQNYKQSGGLLGKIANSVTNRLFPS